MEKYTDKSFKKINKEKKKLVSEASSGIDECFCASYDSTLHAAKMAAGLFNSARRELNQTREGLHWKGDTLHLCALNHSST